MIKFFTKRMKDNKGFTLVELLIVIAVLGILAAIMVPRMTGITDSFKIKSDIESAKTIAKQVEVLTMAGDITSTGFISEGTTGDFGEAFPEPQFVSSGFVAELQTGTDDDFLIIVGYDEDQDGNLGDLPELDDSGDDFTSGTNTPIFSKEIGGKIE